jgi:hypothetical protein
MNYDLKCNQAIDPFEPILFFYNRNRFLFTKYNVGQKAAVGFNHNII